MENTTGGGYPSFGQPRQRKRIILCFDGTGNKFSGTDSDSNILKIYGMLDRDNGDKHYYQPGIGTYVNTSSLSHTSRLSRLNSWYEKAKDSAVGTSFDQHVMGAYKFLMQCYTNDDIYIFGFSRGAYVARFLAEMLDHVGLLSAGNQEMARFAWKAFSQWQQREDNTDEEKKKKREMLVFLKNFRETFSRPVRRIRFLGLFDTVNSVPRFENAWMKRSKFPYSARSSAKVIRHAVSIDERRAKFRQDLMSSGSTSKEHRHFHHHHGEGATPSDQPQQPSSDRFRRRSAVRPIDRNLGQRPSKADLSHLDPRRDTAGNIRNQNPGVSQTRAADHETSSIHTNASLNSHAVHEQYNEGDEDDEDSPQDLEELWFPGCHADLGGGWPLGKGEEAALSHGPLVWMVREAQRAGVEFDAEKMLKFKCCNENFEIPSVMTQQQASGTNAATNVPGIEVTDIFNSPHREDTEPGWAPGLGPSQPTSSTFHDNLHKAFTTGHLHDCLEFRNGLPPMSVLSWKIMEYLPFRRMDLRPDGSWKAITFPLPMGEVRDIPEDAHIHHSAVRRMEANPQYRPGNLIIGGGGRGLRRAPEEMGLGEWDVFIEDGDPVGMAYVRKRANEENQKNQEKVNGVKS